MRRNGHLYDRSADPAKNVHGQGYFVTPELDESSGQSLFPVFNNWQDDSYASFAYPAFDDEVSSCNSHDDEDVDLSDLVHLSYNEAAETVYLGYRTHKRRWRSFAGPRKKGKGKGKGKRSGNKGVKSTPMFKGGGKHTFFGEPQSPQYDQSESSWSHDEYQDPDQAYFGKGKGKRTGNPIGRDGKVMRCSICNSEDHFREHCSKKDSAMGKGKGKSTFMSSDTWPPANPVSQGASSTAGRAVYFSEPSHDTHCMITFEDGSESIALSPVRTRFFAVDSDEAQPSSTSIVRQGFFPWWKVSDDSLALQPNASSDCSQIYHATVRLGAGREGTVVDTGAVTSISGDKWIQRSQVLGEAYGHGTQLKTLAKPFGIEGVGKGSNQVTSEAIVPIALKTGKLGSYSARVVHDSELPALLGLEPMIKQRTLLDLHNGKMIMLGAGGYSLRLAPGSTVLELETAPSGHLILPTSEWGRAKTDGKGISLLAI